MLDWIKKARGGPDHPMRNPTAASALLAELRGTDAVTALNDLSGWLESLEEAPGFDESVRAEVLGLIQEAGEPHVSALLANYIGNVAEKAVLRESKWKALLDYTSTLSKVLCESAESLAATSKAEAHAPSAAAAGAARGLAACRSLAKVCLVRYLSIPGDLWRRAYSVHASTEAGGFATTAAHPQHGQETTTTPTQELLRLLMLQASTPEMMAPEQIEVADRVTLQLASDFVLGPPGVADTLFYFDPDSNRPPRRAPSQQPNPGARTRFFGPGAALDALARLHKQLAQEDVAEVKVFGKDIAPHMQVSAVEHLLRFWGPNPADSRPPHSPVADQLLVVHRYEQICRHLPDVASTIERSSALAMTDTEETKPEPPEEWALRSAGGNELGAEIPQLSGGWARSGELVGVCVRSKNAWWLGVVRRMHAERGGSTRADIAIFSRKPLTLRLRVLGKDTRLPDDWETSSDSFAYRYLDAVLLPDASEKSGKLNLLLPADGWKIRQVYEAPAWEPSRYLRLLRLLKRGAGYARLEFEWLPTPSQKA